MNFNSLSFVIFAATTFCIYYLPFLRGRQVSVLIAASIFFYAFDQPYLLLLLLASATLNAIFSFQVLRTDAHTEKLRWALGCVVANLAVLGFFKYGRLLSSLASGSAQSNDGIGHFLLTLPLPIGISFYTFHGISLLIDVLNRGDPRISKSDRARSAPASFSKHLHQTLLYLIFFPQLIAGPIVKAHFFFPQIGAKALAGIDWPLAIRALITGYFLKRVVADNLQEQTFWIAFPYFQNLSTVNLLTLLFGYSMQIFADFAGYSLIAIGLAALFGYRLPQNFNFPYLSQTFSEFWTRWHMSLSSFLREYLYYPLGGNRKGPVRTYVNLMTVMALGGLWHGAAISYAVWGAWHGLALVIERLFRNSWFYRCSNTVAIIIRTGLVFSFVSMAWLLFKLPHFREVIAYVAAIGSNLHVPIQIFQLILIITFASPVIAYYAFHLLRRWVPQFVELARPAIYGAMLMAIILNSGRSNAFIYFQF